MSRLAPGCARKPARRVFVEAIGPPPRLVAVGAGDIAEALCALARPLGWRTVVVDPRAGLATRERVPSADEMIVAWPDEIEIDAGTALVSLVHEERIDLPALRRGVEGGAFYVGALGSKRTQAKRREHLGAIAERGSRAGRPRPRRRDTRGDRTRDHRRGARGAPERARLRRARGTAGRSRQGARVDPAGGEADAEQSDPEQEMQPVVGGVRGQPTCDADGADHPECQVDDPASRQELARALGGPARTRPTTPKSRWKRLCRIDTWNVPSSFAPLPCPAKLRSP